MNRYFEHHHQQHKYFDIYLIMTLQLGTENCWCLAIPLKEYTCTFLDILTILLDDCLTVH